MRAVGYVAPHRLPTSLDDTDESERVSWSAVVEPSAGSWGAAETGGVSLEPPPDDPPARIVHYCATGGHNLVAIFGVAGGSESLMEQLGLPEQAAEDDAANAMASDEAQFLNLLSVLTPPAGHPALVLIDDAAHLASDVESLIRRLIQIRSSGSDAQCTDPDTPDPLLSGLSMLPLTADDAAEAGGVRGGDNDGASAELHARDTGGPVGLPKVIELAASGRVLGRTPFGYRADADGTLEPVPHEAQVVRRVFDWYVGRDRDGGGGDATPIGMRTIVQRLQDDGVGTRSGKPWSTAAISLMLKNKVYVGTYERYGFMVAGNHAPLIERAVWNAAQARLAKPRATHWTADSQFLLGGLVRCARCEHAVPGLSRKRTWRRKDGTEVSKVYRYYEWVECQWRNSQDRQDDGKDVCPRWRADRLEGLAKERIVGLPADALDSIVPRDADADLEREFLDARRGFAAAVQQVGAGKGDLEHLIPELDALGAARARLQGAGSTRRSRARLRRLVRDHVANLAADVDWQTSRDAVYALVDHVAVTSDDVRIIYRDRQD